MGNPPDVTSSQKPTMILAIEASNIRGGGGVTHLCEMLAAADPGLSGISEVHIFTSASTAAKLPVRKWLIIHSPAVLEESILRRFFWQKFVFSRILRQLRCNVLFVPGGTFIGNFRPFVTMHQNLLPFEWPEIKRYGFSLAALRLVLLRHSQGKTFRKAATTIFLSEYARKTVSSVLRYDFHTCPIIHHGINPDFFENPKKQNPITSYNAQKPFRLLYVSFIGNYKHQWNVIEAVSLLRNEGFPVVLELIGPEIDKLAVRKVRQALSKFDKHSTFTNFLPGISYPGIKSYYRKADLFIFASSCETFGQILTEAMAAGLPIACSGVSAMPELLRDAGEYFDPLQPDDIRDALKRLILNPRRRSKAAKLGRRYASEFSWKSAAKATLEACAYHRAIS